MRRLASIPGLSTLWVVTALAFANAPIGTTIENVALPSLAGGEEQWLSATNVSLFLFINPELEHSNQALAEISVCAKAMTNQTVHWCAIVSDRIARADLESQVRASGWTAPVLIDRGDALFGKLGVVMRPAIGITDERRTLVAYEHFTRVNFAAVVQAQVRHALKEISDDELAQTLHPPAAAFDENESVAHRYLRLAQKQFAHANYEQALANIQISLERKPTADALALREQVLAAQRQPAETAEAFAAASKLATAKPDSPPALKPAK